VSFTENEGLSCALGRAGIVVESSSARIGCKYFRCGLPDLLQPPRRNNRRRVTLRIGTGCLRRAWVVERQEEVSNGAGIFFHYDRKTADRKRPR
jgi:hypothetical protein